MHSESDLNPLPVYASPHIQKGAGAAAAYLATRPRTFGQNSEARIRENPTVAVVGALVVGLVLGRVAGNLLVD